MTDQWQDGDDPPPNAKAETEAMLADPRNQRAQGSPDDLATIDDPVETPDGEE